MYIKGALLFRLLSSHFDKYFVVISQGTDVSVKRFALFYWRNHAGGSVLFRYWALGCLQSCRGQQACQLFLSTPNIIEVVGIGIGEEYPVTFYAQLIQWLHTYIHTYFI